MNRIYILGRVVNVSIEFTYPLAAPLIIFDLIDSQNNICFKCIGNGEIVTRILSCINNINGKRCEHNLVYAVGSINGSKCIIDEVEYI